MLLVGEAIEPHIVGQRGLHHARRQPARGLVQIGPVERDRPGIEHGHQIGVVHVVEQLFVSGHGNADVVVVLQPQDDAVGRGGRGGLPQGLDAAVPVRLVVRAAGFVTAEDANDPGA